MRRACTVRHNSPRIAWPFKRYDICPRSSGAAAVVLATNAYTPSLGYFTDRILPLHSHVVAGLENAPAALTYDSARMPWLTTVPPTPI